jgi:hypothetical protein
MTTYPAHYTLSAQLAAEYGPLWERLNLQLTAAERNGDVGLAIVLSDELADLCPLMGYGPFCSGGEALPF